VTVRRLLIVGAGGWGKVHGNVYAEHRQWTVSAIADADPSVLAAAGERFGVPPDRLYHDPARAIAEAQYDAISVVIRNPFKTPILARALQTGVPVFTEKPLCHTVDDLRRIRAAAALGGGPLMVSQNYRFDPQARGVREMIQEKKLWGPLQGMLVDFARRLGSGDAHITRFRGGLGLNAEMCIHHYDLMRYLTGSDPHFIRAIARESPRGGTAGWDTLDVLLEFPDLLTACYHASYDVPESRTPWGGEWTLDFAEGSLVFCPYADGAYPVRYSRPWTHAWRPDAPLPDREHAYRHNLVAEAFDEFTRALDEGRQPECSLEDNTRSVAMMLAVTEAADTGDTIEFGAFLDRVTGNTH